MQTAKTKRCHMDHYIPWPQSSQADNRGRRRFIKLLAAFTASVLLALQYTFYVTLEPKHTEVMIFPERSTHERDFDWLALEPKRDIEWVSCYGGQKCSLPLYGRVYSYSLRSESIPKFRDCATHLLLSRNTSHSN
ncbi:hypothetical protein C8Q80DRAFT_1185826 [Daedaleopsis nitida]|nr:hypothetical protein C8Q80DRAFT_1185826 [Daedaleopsis nitida]